MIYVVGHKVPDSDAVCAAIAVAELKRQLGFDCEPRVAGEINGETEFILKRFGVKVPDVLEDAENKEVILVDHTDLSQGVDGLDKAKIVGIVDHHKLGGVKTSVPVEVLIRPIGSSCTVVKGLFDYYKKEIPEDIAGLMLCAILSDTVIFKSPTTMDEDRRVAGELAKIVTVENVEELGMEMFRIKSNVDGVGAKDLVVRDYKDFEISGKTIGVGQLELIDLDMIKDRESELVEEMGKLKDDGREAVFLMLTDIMKKGSLLLCVSNKPDLRSDIFGESEDGWYDGMMSRKKQIVPKLEEFFK